MSDITVISDGHEVDTLNLSAIDTLTLKAELAKALTVTAKHLVYLAAVWHELESRGEDLSNLRTGLAIYLPQIAAGRLDADLVIRYAGQKMLLGAMAKLSISDQQALLDSGCVTVAKSGERGEVIEVSTPLHHLAATDIRMIFGEHGVRPPAEQISLKGKSRPAKRAKFRKARRVEIDQAGGSIIVGSASVKIERVIELLSEYYGINVAEKIGDASR